MPRFTQTRAEWMAVADELAGPHRAAAPPGLEERVRALLRGVPAGWPDQTATLDLDEGNAQAVRAVLAGLAGRDPAAGQRSASVGEAEAIVREGQRGRGQDDDRDGELA